MTIKINGTEMEVTFSEVYTRKIDREFNTILFEGVNFSNVNKDWVFNIDPMNIQRSNDYLIKAMTNLTEKDIDNLDIKDYNEILKKVNEIKTGSK